MTWHDVAHVLLHSLRDTLMLLPFLLAIFILLAVIEARMDFKKHARVLGGRLAPLIGSVTGVIPQCGFSVMSVKLYQGRFITVGTMLAIFVSTSDEAITLLLSQGRWREFLVLAAIKMAIGCAVGYLADFLLHGRKELRWGEAEMPDACGCHHHTGGRGKLFTYLWHPLIHCLKTLAYVFAVNVFLGLLVALVGEQNIEAFMAGTGYFQPFVAALIGLIPNCASSVLLVEVFVAGKITFGALVAGLTANAGVGLALLFKENKNVKRNLLIVFILYFAGVIFGELITLITTLIA